MGPGAAATAAAAAAGTSRPAGSTRREATRRLLASAVAAAMAPVVVGASRPARPGDTTFEETYRGRRIRGVWRHRSSGVKAGEWHVTVDGRPLHLMRRADGTWLSLVDHYQSYRTPLEAARGAVDELGPGQRLRDLAPGPVGEELHRLLMGGAHGGVHA
ncbi:tyrosinase cofactor [Streptomyces carpinensis]|uniref:tyrosinase cofactor n=1 Tax=Streptomyces carpinensis TaxID=66369 RepID=UPI001FC97A1B|nr:tyrosinase cofactor [Streptomyces carpinensis]